MTIFSRFAAIAAIILASGFALDPAPVVALVVDKPVQPPAPPAPDAEALALTDPILAPADAVLTPAVVEPAKPAAKSLAAAVAAPPEVDAPDEDLRCLATAIYYESKGEPLLGQLGVAQVVINRTRSGRFPSSICGVVMQPRQFSFVRGGYLPSPGAGNAAYRTAMAVARVAMAGEHDSPAADALYFHAAHVNPKWSKRQLAAIGRHKFYR